MSTKLIYWIPVIGAFVSLAHYEKENNLGEFWSYYQAFMMMAVIWIIAFVWYG